MKNSWLSVYLYYGEPWENLLTKGIYPFSEKMKSHGLIKSYFYIRYWDKGPHIRLRLNCEKNARNEIKEDLVKYFESYFKINPSTIDPKELLNRKVKEFRPNNTLYFTKYLPEYQMYGGKLAMHAAEKQFQLSSQIVLGTINEFSNWSSNDAITHAIIFNLLIAHAFCRSKKKITKFFELLTRNLLPFAKRLMNTSKNPLNENPDDILNSFKGFYDSQKESIFLIVKEVNKCYKLNEPIFDNKLTVELMSGMKQVAKELLCLERSKQLVTHKWFIRKNGINKEDFDMPLWAIVFKYIHMNNNRLGIPNVDEPYISYLIMQTYKEYGSKL
jgi:uncharacterized protein YhbP (UPF0306 family)